MKCTKTPFLFVLCESGLKKVGIKLSSLRIEKK